MRLPLHFTAYCPEFDHIMVMQFAHAAHIPEMVQAILYAIVINDAAKLRLIRRETKESLMLDLRKLRWDIIEAWLLSIEDKLKDTQVSSPGEDGRRKGKKKEMVHFPNFTSTEMAAEYIQETFRWPLREILAQRLRPLLKDHLILCPSFDLGVATRYAQDSNTPEMVQAIFYAMVVNDNLDEVPDVGPTVAALRSLRVLVQERRAHAQGSPRFAPCEPAR
ncbi:hypothetical protein Cgig2_025436 [Carnegiea gigantea]|uniref:Uncharacterized protein n=1 Tax=Carnegiea gigantea TaxID=171969 RepID=A0A9Q1QMB2_9CARY|nr:hypothetical protein Cgig2_025436 [Carnegiea gigantea]